MSKLVSIIIPCFNAQRWLAEAIESCLRQTYPQREIIIIDDGSTDGSVEILKRYKAAYPNIITWQTGRNRGGSHARNRGIALAQGDYIQFLDADDYILPEKIDKQVNCLEQTRADVVYGDWVYKHHPPNESSFLSQIKVCGPKTDFLESLLSNDRWSPPAALLFTRSAVHGSGGWDESLKAAQDRDFFISVAMNGAKFVYQVGCDSVYREYGRVTVSTSCKRRWFDSHCYVMEKAERRLAAEGRLTLRYRKALAQAYFDMGREYVYSHYPQLEDEKYRRFLIALNKALSLHPGFKAGDRTLLFNLIQSVLGCRSAEMMSYLMAKLKVSLRTTPANQLERNFAEP
jgi:glycosyltransferase involved in cell wall biosynthesis